MTKSPWFKFFFPFAFSILWHLGLFLFVILIYNSISLKYPKPRELTQIELESQVKQRTVGVKDGSQNFTEKIIHPGQKAEENMVGSRVVTLSDLSTANAQMNPGVMSSVKSESGVVITKGFERNTPTFKTTEKDRDFNKRVLQELSVDDDDARALKVAGFNINFTPPEGVSEDELNSTEKIFYAFQKRTFLSYVNSFLKAYNEIAITRPNFKKTFMSEKHTMVGKVTFDKEGNVISVKILQWSLNDDMEKLFEMTLEYIKSLPNPPKAYLGTDGQFSMYYQLKING